MLTPAPLCMLSYKLRMLQKRPSSLNVVLNLYDVKTSGCVTLTLCDVNKVINTKGYCAYV